MKVEYPLTTMGSKHDLVQQLQTQNRKPLVWTRDKTNQLIELYKKHECLWNYWHEAYKNKDKRNRAIEDICTTLNVQKFEFGKKIHNLRNQFNTEMKKFEQRIEEAGVNAYDNNDKDLRCKWNHFEPLMFLRDVIEPRPGGYQSTFQPPKKMRLKFNFNSSEDDINVTTVMPGGRANNIATNIEEFSHLQYEDNENEEVITDDYQSFENEAVKVGQPHCSEEVCDKKCQVSQQHELSSRRFINTPKNKKSLHLTQTSSTCSSQTDLININKDSPIIELNSTAVVPSHLHTLTTSSSTPSTTTPVNSSVTSSNRPESLLRDQWDAFGELVANEFRNLNSEISQKRLKRKIMQAMLEVGEEDDKLITNSLRIN